MTGLSLEVSGLNVFIDGRHLLKDISFSVPPGKKVGFIGSSGSGKTLTALAISGLLPRHAEVTGSVILGERELIGLGEKELARIRGDLIGMVFQEPKTALNPLKKLGRQITEALTNHYSLSSQQQKEAAVRLARQVGLSEPERIIDSYPHEVSGGQRQRAAIAAAISASPSLLFADEPTTALDVTVQQGVVQLFNELSAETGMSLVFITHDIAVLAMVAEHILVFHDGRIIESAPVTEILSHPGQPVTRQLIEAATLAQDVFSEDALSSRMPAAQEGGVSGNE